MNILNLKRLVSTTFLASFFQTVHSADVIIEWAPFVKHSQVSDTQLILLAEKVQNQFISKQKGYIKRELIKKSDSEYADLIYWQSKQDAENAGKLVYSCEVCVNYFKTMDETKKTSSEFSHYSILKSWN